nr:Os05g0467150 [Ipomoea batatas]
MDGLIVLIRVFQAHNVGMLRQMFHDLNLPPNILNIHSGPQLLLGNRFAGQMVAGGFINAQICNPKFAPPELAAQLVCGLDIVAGRVFQHIRPVSAVSVVIVSAIVDGERGNQDGFLRGNLRSLLN